MIEDIELYRYNWDRLIIDLMNLGIDDKYKLEKILLAFGERCGNRYYLMTNEVWDEYNSFSGVIEVIKEYFGIDVKDVFTDNRTYLPKMCRSIWGVAEELDL